MKASQNLPGVLPDAVYRDGGSAPGPAAGHENPVIVSLAELAREMPAGLATAEVRGMLERMSDADLIDLRRPPHPRSAVTPDAAAAAFWALGGLDADEAARAIGTATVEIVAVGRTDAAPAAAACAESGLACCEQGTADATVSVVLC